MPDPATSEHLGGEALEAFYAALLDDDPERLYERAPCGYLSMLPDGTIVKVNQTFLAWTGYERGDLVGRKTFSELLTGGGRIYHETHYRPILEMHGVARAIALDIVGVGGRRLPALVNAVLERDEAGAPAVVRAAVFDASERRQYERELLRAKEAAEASEERARTLVRTLQQTLMPPTPPEVPGMDVAAAYVPAGRGDEVGGDFYDVFELGAGDWMVVVGDVSGKGVDAAVVTALARYTIRGAAVREDRPSRVLAALNEVLLRDAVDRFCTVVAVRLRDEGDRWAATIGCGGHPPPVLVGGGSAPTAVGRPGTLIGMFDHPRLHDTELVLDAGDALVLYTDGVTEARRGREFLGEDGLQAAVSRHAGSAAALTQGILADVMAFQGEAPRDDIVLVALQVPGPTGPSSTLV